MLVGKILGGERDARNLQKVGVDLFKFSEDRC